MTTLKLKQNAYILSILVLVLSLLLTISFVAPASAESTLDQATNIIASDNVQYSSNAITVGPWSSSMVKIKEITMPIDYTGSWRITYQSKSGDDYTDFSRTQIYKNGVPWGNTQRGGYASYQTKSQDFSSLSINSGDKIQIYGHSYYDDGDYEGWSSMTIRNLQIKFDVVVDTTSPSYFGQSTNTTFSGESVLFNINYDDDFALHPGGQYIFATNNSGTWINESAVDFSSTPQTISTIKTLNSKAGLTIGYRWYAVDNAGNIGDTPIYTLTTTTNPAPTYSGQSTSTTIIGKSALFNIIYNDDMALHPGGQYIFATNNSGAWINESAVNFISTPQTISTIKTLNSKAGLTIGYRWYAVDNTGNIGDTPIYTLTTTAPPAPTYSGPTELWTILAEYMVNPTGWGGISSPDAHRIINIIAAPLDSTGHYIKGLAPLEAKIYDPSDSFVGSVTLNGTGPYNGTYLLDDGAISGMYSIKITSYPIFGNFSVLRWSCINCHSDSERYQTTFNNGAVHSQHDDTLHSTGCDSSCHYDPWPDEDEWIHDDSVTMIVDHASKSGGQCTQGCHMMSNPHVDAHLSEQSCNNNACHKPDPGLACNECHNDVQNSLDALDTSVLSPMFGRDVHYLQKNCPDCHGSFSSIDSTPPCTNCHPLAGPNLVDYTIPDSIRSKAHSPDQNVSCGLCHSTSHDLHKQSIGACPDCHDNPHITYPQPCTDCHGSDIHEIKPGGGPDCMASSCHAGDIKPVNMSFFNNSVHKNLNSGAANTPMSYEYTEACWLCHGNGTQPTTHLSNLSEVKTCYDALCHFDVPHT